MWEVHVLPLYCNVFLVRVMCRTETVRWPGSCRTRWEGTVGPPWLSAARPPLSMMLKPGPRCSLDRGTCIHKLWENHQNHLRQSETRDQCGAKYRDDVQPLLKDKLSGSCCVCTSFGNGIPLYQWSNSGFPRMSQTGWQLIRVHQKCLSVDSQFWTR